MSSGVTASPSRAGVAAFALLYARWLKCSACALRAIMVGETRWREMRPVCQARSANLLRLKNGYHGSGVVNAARGSSSCRPNAIAVE